MKSWLRDAAVIDWETLPIGDRPRHPPAPVGVAIRIGCKAARYLAFGHPSGGNTHSWGDVRRELGELYESGRPLLFHNAKFDVEVGEVHFGMPHLSWDRYHDTLPLLFLDDPRADSFGLKPASERLLRKAPEERDEVIDWLIEHQPVPGVRLSRSRNSANYAGAYIAYAPASIVGKYAVGDVDRTFELADALVESISRRGMDEAYDRERELMPSLLDMERQGVRVDLAGLGRDITRYEAQLERLESWLIKRLQAAPDINLDSGPQLAEAIVRAKLARRQDLGVTATGKMQTNKEALTAAVKDPQILAVLKYRAQLGTCLKTFMRPWFETASRSGGYIFTTWNSTRNDRGDGSVGTRTGRLSSTPNFQNIANEFAPLFAELAAKLSPELRAQLPKAPIEIEPLPLVRSYIVPYEAGHVLVGRDYSQQELRILAHFEDGELLEAYRREPWLDLHDYAQQLINGKLGTSFDRKKIKTTGFGLVYGMGLGKLAEQTGSTIEQAKELKAAYLATFPGIKAIYADAKQRAQTKQPIRTWGGRQYYCEAPKNIDGRLVHFDYKLPNVLVQGSAADCTKEAMRRYFRAKPAHHRALLTVHDELLISAPRAELHEAMETLRVAMESVQFDLPMLSEGEWSSRNWEEMQPYDKKGERVLRERSARAG